MSTDQQEQDVLAVSGLCIDVRDAVTGPRRVVDAVSFSIRPGQILALVGESGSGKTMIGRSVPRLLPPVASIAAGDITFQGESLPSVDEARLRMLRGRRIGMVFQEPMASLNPALTVGYQMTEAMRLHEKLTKADARRRCLAMLEKVRLPRPAAALDAYPHEFSGGMRQRIMLASVLAMRPALLIADEPTTALDALIRKEIMDLLVSLTREIQAAVLLISHDLGLVAQYADHAVVLRNGRTLESGPAAEVLLRPGHPYTRALMNALPARGRTAPVVPCTPMVEVKGLCVEVEQHAFSLRRRMRRIIDRVTLSIQKGEMFAVVGESGSGKTTVGRTLLRLCGNSHGTILFDGHDLRLLDRRSLTSFRTRTQMVSQNPYSSLDPRMRLDEIVAEGLRHVGGLSRSDRMRRACEMLGEVGLESDLVQRFPHELSGGQRQRVCIARSVVAHPQFIVADEPVSALDVTIQQQILRLLLSLQDKYRFSCLFISHDLAVVEQIADRVAVMYRGRILEVGPRGAIFDAPRHPYTLRLLEATPRVVPQTDDSYALTVVVPKSTPPPEGFIYFDDNSVPDDSPSDRVPAMVEVGPGHLVCCHSI